MLDKKKDEKLFIRTRGIREWSDPNSKFNRCESTPYKALRELFKYYSIEREDQFVDFGCGRGRVAFYVHNKLRIPVTGIEAHDTTFDELLKNQDSYRYKYSNIDVPLYFEYGYAENYNIDKKDNIFYFFNPFKLVVFEKVVENILKSVKENPRVVDIIFYYPLPPFKKYLKNNTPFTLINKIKVPSRKDSREKFHIYRYDNRE